MLHFSSADLQAYALGKLIDDHSEPIEQHIDTCTACQVTLDGLDLDGDNLMQALRYVRAENAKVQDDGWQDFEERIKAIGVTWSHADNATVEATPLRPQRLRDYDLLDQLGRGGMGTVYRAMHSRLKKLVAVKVLTEDRMENAEAVRRFEREMQAVGRLSHPHIVQATDAGEVEGTYFLVMEYIEGLNLSQLVDRCGPLPVADACELVRQAALGLQHAHAHGMVHRDIKPSNLILSDTGEVKILDLGLALLSEGPAGGGELTSTNQIMGTLDYMAPEQASNTHAVDIRADLYSLGATLYKLLSGRTPLQVDGRANPVKKLNLLLNAKPEPILATRPDVPQQLAELLERLLDKSVDRRPATPADLIAELGAFVAAADIPRLIRVSKVGIGSSEAIPLATTSRIEVPSHSSIPATQTAAPHAETVTEPSLLPTLSLPARPPRRRTGIVMAALVAFLFAGLVVITTKHGIVTIETAESLPDAIIVKITPLAGGDQAVAVLDKQGNWTAKIAGGEYSLELLGGEDEFDLQDRTLTVSRFGTTLVRITHDPKKIDEPPTQESHAVAAAEQAGRAPSSGATASQQATEYALLLDGHDDYVDLPFECPADTPLTIEAWITPATANAYQEIVQSYDGYRAGLATALTDRGLPGAGVIENGSWQLARATDPVAVGVATHIAGVFDGRQMRFFVDGKLVAMSAALQRSFLPFSNTFRIGRAHDNSRSQPYRGLIDEIRISTIARYEADFVPQRRFTPDEQTLGLYHCDEPRGERLRDASGHGHHGLITGAVRVSIDEVGGDIDRWIDEREQRAFEAEQQIVRELFEWSETAQSTKPEAELVITVATRDGQRHKVRALADLPSDGFHVTYVDFKWLAGIGADLLRRLQGLPELGGVGLVGNELTEGEVSAVVNLRDLQVLYLWYQPQLTDAALMQIADLTKLHTLDLGGSTRKLTDAGLRSLHPLRHLRILRTRHVPLTDAAFVDMPALRTIEFLDVHDTRVGDPTLAVLAGNSRLRTLMLGSTAITDAGLARLGQVASLRQLEVPGTGIDGSGLAAFRGSGIVTLYAGTTNIDDAALAHIGRMPALITLSLNRTAITDAGLPHLRRLSALRTLELQGTQVTREGVEALSTALPECRIDWDGGVVEPLPPVPPNPSPLSAVDG